MLVAENKKVEIADNDGTHVIARPHGSNKAYRLYQVRESNKGKYIIMRGRRIYSEDWEKGLL